MGEQKKSKPVVFVDMDGVLTDWRGHALSLVGIDRHNEDARRVLAAGSADAFEAMFGARHALDLRVAMAGPEFWRTIPLFPWAIPLMDKLWVWAESGYFEIGVLTSPGRWGAHSASAKHEVIAKNFPFIQDTIICKHKYLCAAPDRVLIDDWSHQITQWEEFGGQGYLWPNDAEFLVSGCKDFSYYSLKFNQVVFDLCEKLIETYPGFEEWIHTEGFAA